MIRILVLMIARLLRWLASNIDETKLRQNLHGKHVALRERIKIDTIQLVSVPVLQLLHVLYTLMTCMMILSKNQICTLSLCKMEEKDPMEAGLSFSP